MNPTLPQEAATGRRRRQGRRLAQMGFFVLFVIAPLFDLFRFDLSAGHAIVFGWPWRLGIDEFMAGRVSAAGGALQILLRLFLPLVLTALIFFAAAARWGRLYCGWLCPHFSVVETLNQLMVRACGKPSLWERKPLSPRQPDGRAQTPDPRWWGLTLPLSVFFAFIWAVVLLTYLWPPVEVYSGLWSGRLGARQSLFIGVATLVFTAEFLFARHLFCRFGCALGLLQSLAWMANRGGLVVGFARRRGRDCAACYAASGPGQAACEQVCPMRLRPRQRKAAMFTCTQCAQCVSACQTVQHGQGRTSLLRWVSGPAARQNEAPVSLTGERDEEGGV